MDRPQRSRRTKTKVDYAGLEEDGGGGSDNDFADAPASANKKPKAAAPKERRRGASEAGDQCGGKKASRLDRQAKLEERFNCDLQHAINESLQTIASTDVRFRSSVMRPAKHKPLNPGDDSDDCNDADDFKAANASVIVVDDDVDCSAETNTRQAKPRVARKPSVAASSTTEPSARGIDAGACPVLERQDVVTSPRKRGRPKKDAVSPIVADAAFGGDELVRTAASTSTTAVSHCSTERTANSKRAKPKQKALHRDESDDGDDDGEKSDDDDFSAEDVDEGGSDDESEAESESEEDENRRPSAKSSCRRGAATKSPTPRRQSAAAMKSPGAVGQRPSLGSPAVSVSGSGQAPCRWKPPAMLGQAPGGRSGSGSSKMGSSVVATASHSPGTLRLGLSKMTRLKPLHPSVKST